MSTDLNYKLSVCVLTHQRPHLFERCIKSILKLKPYEILVNNDSHDITEVDGATYFYESAPINQLYELVYLKARGTHIWFMEDDDIALQLPAISSNVVIHRYLNHDNHVIEPDLNSCEFQLSQCSIPKHMIDFTVIEQRCGCIFNDWHLVKMLPYEKNSKIIFKQYYCCDNISFYQSERFKGSGKCLSCSWLPNQMQSELKEHLPDGKFV